MNQGFFQGLVRRAIDVNSSAAALRITQTGSGNALVVEDSSSTDATPFIIDANGNVGIGVTVAGNKLSIRDGDVALVAGPNAVDAGQTIRFFANGVDDSSDNYAGIKGGLVTAASPQLGYLAFSTSGSERARIDSAGNVGIGTTANAAAILDVSSTTKGFLPPRMTGVERDAINTPPAGLMVYNTTTNKLNFYNGSAWEAVTSS
jgi:hypothetical protein